MYARAVDEAGSRLRELHREQWLDFALAALVSALALAASAVRPALAIPLFLGALYAWGLGIRALFRHWDLLDRLADERDAYVVPEVASYASRHATMERRHSFAALIRLRLAAGPPCPAGAELEALTAELDDDELALDPACAFACMRLLTDLDRSPLLNPSLPPEELRARAHRIRAGFEPRRIGDPS